MTDLQQLEVEIITECTIFVILFSGAFSLLMKSAGKRSRGTTSELGIKMPLIRGFMDDIIVACRTVIEEELNNLITWASMKFKAPKSRRRVLKKRKVTNRYKFRINNNVIPTLSEVQYWH